MLKSTITLNNILFPVDLCITAEEQAQGLMFKKEAISITAFPSITPKIRKFWMKNTFIPLDIIFACNNQIISICQGNPHDLTLVGPDVPCDLVIEAPRGFAQKHNLQIGSEVKLKYSIFDLRKEYNLFIK